MKQCDLNLKLSFSCKPFRNLALKEHQCLFKNNNQFQSSHGLAGIETTVKQINKQTRRKAANKSLAALWELVKISRNVWLFTKVICVFPRGRNKIIRKSDTFRSKALSRFAVSFRGINRLGSAFIALRSFKLARICFQVTILYKGYEA